jgi:hypothetical protein
MELDLSKPNQKWSHSRFNTFNTCKNKYKLQYLAQLIVTGKEIEVTDKGLSLHNIAEQMNSKISLEELIEIAKKDLEERKFDQEKFPILKIIPRFFEWWQEFVIPFENNGFKLYKESWEKGTILDKNVVGALDTLLINESTKEIRIYDFKTPKTPNTASYKNQMLLYAFLISRRLKIDNIAEKIKIFIFFPLANIDDDEINNKELAKKQAMKMMKQIIFSDEDIRKIITEYETMIIEDESIDWSLANPMEDAKLGYYCSWCQFAGSKKYCPVSYESGCRLSRSVKIMTKEEYEKTKNSETQ